MPETSSGCDNLPLTEQPEPSGRREAVAILLLTLLGMGTLALLQFTTAGFVDPDSYYHSKAALLISKHALLPFRWLPLTVLEPAAYVDHHFLFHVLLAPLVSVSLRAGAKWGAVAVATLAFCTFLFALPRGTLTKFSGSVLYFSASAGFLYRMSMIRAQSASLLLLFLAVGALAERRYRLLGVISFVYVWTYNAFPLLVVLACCFFLSERLIEKRMNYVILCSVALGLGAGLLINPFFPENIFFLAHHLSDKFGFSRFSVSVGGEWYAYTWSQLLEYAVVPLACSFVAAVLLLARFGKLSTSSVALQLFSWFTLFLLFRSKRFIELYPPFAILALLWISRDTLQRTWRTRFWLALSGAALLMLPTTLSKAAAEIRSGLPYAHYQETASWLAAYSDEGDLVWTADWDDFPRLFHFNDRNSYLVGLDPYFLYAKHPELFKLWVAMTQGESKGSMGLKIRRCFGARFVFADTEHRALRRQLEEDPGIVKLFENDDSAIFEACPPATNCELEPDLRRLCTPEAPDDPVPAQHQ